MMDTSEAMAILSRPRLIEVLLDIMREYGEEGTAHPISRFAANGGPNWRTRYVRIHDLADAGLVTFERGGQHNTARIIPTEAGLIVYEHLRVIAAIMGADE